MAVTIERGIISMEVDPYIKLISELVTSGKLEKELIDSIEGKKYSKGVTYPHIDADHAVRVDIYFNRSKELRIRVWTQKHNYASKRDEALYFNLFEDTTLDKVSEITEDFAKVATHRLNLIKEGCQGTNMLIMASELRDRVQDELTSIFDRLDRCRINSVNVEVGRMLDIDDFHTPRAECSVSKTNSTYQVYVKVSDLSMQVPHCHYDLTWDNKVAFGREVMDVLDGLVKRVMEVDLW